MSAPIDTGFEEARMLLLPDVVSTGLKLVGVVPVELADGYAVICPNRWDDLNNDPNLKW